jgi:GNAT superfamily N-acetyltransferase
LLIDHPEAIEPLVALFETEWADWYNPQGASARSDLSERARRNGLPLGIVAMRDEAVLGTCAIMASSGGLVTERSPWLGGLLVDPAHRRQGVAAALLARAGREAGWLGYRRLYGLTAEASALFESQGWRMIDTIDVDRRPHRVFAIPL